MAVPIRSKFARSFKCGIQIIYFLSYWNVLITVTINKMVREVADLMLSKRQHNLVTSNELFTFQTRVMCTNQIILKEPLAVIDWKKSIKHRGKRRQFKSDTLKQKLGRLGGRTYY